MRAQHALPWREDGQERVALQVASSSPRGVALLAIFCALCEFNACLDLRASSYQLLVTLRTLFPPQHSPCMRIGEISTCVRYPLYLLMLSQARRSLHSDLLKLSACVDWSRV